MSEEMRLVRIGFPLEDALAICHSMRREGTLKAFVERQEQLYYDRILEEDDDL